MHGILAALERWSIERISDWYVRLPWLCGFNYLPRTAVNWTELWQRESFDPATIEQELGWARDVGFNTLRTNLQFLVWLDDAAGLRDRLDRFLGIAARRGIRTMLCLFDDCAFSGPGRIWAARTIPSRAPRSRAPRGAATSRARPRALAELERYVRVVSHFDDDARARLDLYNEPERGGVHAPRRARPRGPLVEHSMALAEGRS
jgi:hypothetical protein